MILAHSTSSVLEDSRLEATRALKVLKSIVCNKNGVLESQTNVSCVLNLISKDYLPVLKQRSVKDMAMVLQYGIANIVNAALRLLEVGVRVQHVCSSRITDFCFQDEEEEVREAAASFASDLPRVHTEVFEDIKKLLD